MGLLEAGGVEGVGFYFAFVALGGDFFAVEEEADAGGVSCFYYDLVGGADGDVCGRDQSFASHGVAVSHERDPGCFLGTDQQGESTGRLRRRSLGLGGWYSGVRFGGRLTRWDGDGRRRGW